MYQRVSKQERFHDQRLRAIWQDMLARVTGRSNDLLPFELLSHAMRAFEQVARPQVQAVPLDRIIGSVGRYKEFTRGFRPRSNTTRDRWLNVAAAMDSTVGVPPIEVYRIGDVYFVSDGNHRVSVARSNGYKAIDAYVTDIHVDCDLTPGDTLDRAIIKAERARFMAATGLRERVGQVDIAFTRPGGFGRLLDHIAVHRTVLSENYPATALPSFEDAALDWYQHVYLPSAAAIRRRRLLLRLPHRTPADLYVWIWGYMLEAYRLFGEQVDPEEAVAMLDLRAGQGLRSIAGAMVSRLAYSLRRLVGSRQSEQDWVTDTFRDEGTGEHEG